MSKGTPLTMREAISDAIYLGPLSETENRILAAVKDFTAQKFSVAYIKATPEELDKLDELYKKLFFEPKKEIPIEDQMFNDKAFLKRHGVE